MLSSRAAAAVFLLAVLSVVTPALAHPVPFSYVDVRLQPGIVDVSIVVHVFDVAHDIGVTPPERLLDLSVLEKHAGAITALVRNRLQLAADSLSLAKGDWRGPEPLADRQSLKLDARFKVSSDPGVTAVTAVMFPYDPQHRTFVNFYEQGEITAQVILESNLPTFQYFAGTRHGVSAVIQKFVPVGVHHILIGPDHLLFLVGLLLLGGLVRRLLMVVTAFTIGHSITLSVSALNIFSPPPQLVEPAIALSIIYVGADNLLVRNGRDMRGWIALAFGFIHGFGFAGVLRDMGLPSRAFGWSLFSFNLGVEIGQLFVVLSVAWALTALRARSEIAGRRLAFAGSIVVIAAGAFWFVRRVFFPGGIA